MTEDTVTERIRAYLGKRKELRLYGLRNGISEMGLECIVYIGINRAMPSEQEVCTKEIFDALSHHPTSSVCRAMVCLEKKELVNKRPLPDDRKSNLVSLTDKGIEIYEGARVFFVEPEGGSHD
jgi:hypothetical protein